MAKTPEMLVVCVEGIEIGNVTEAFSDEPEAEESEIEEYARAFDYALGRVCNHFCPLVGEKRQCYAKNNGPNGTQRIMWEAGWAAAYDSAWNPDDIELMEWLGGGVPIGSKKRQSGPLQ